MTTDKPAETIRLYPGMLPDEDDLEPLESDEFTPEIKACMSCMAPNDVDASKCFSCCAVFGLSSIAFPAAPVRRYRSRRGAVKPSRLEVVVTCILNLAFIGWNVAAIRNVFSGPITPFARFLLIVGVLFLALSLRNLYLIAAAYRNLPSYWDGDE